MYDCISRTAYYRRLCHYQKHGVDGLRDSSKQTHRCPHRTHVDVVGKILYLGTWIRGPLCRMAG